VFHTKAELTGKPSVAQKSDDSESIVPRIAANSGWGLGSIIYINCKEFAIGHAGQFQQLYLNIFQSENTNLPDTGTVRQFLKHVILNRREESRRFELRLIVKHCHPL
jgi:hypothetical protein